MHRALSLYSSWCIAQSMLPGAAMLGVRSRVLTRKLDSPLTASPQLCIQLSVLTPRNCFSGLTHVYKLSWTQRTMCVKRVQSQHCPMCIKMNTCNTVLDTKQNFSTGLHIMGRQPTSVHLSPVSNSLQEEEAAVPNNLIT